MRAVGGPVEAVRFDYERFHAALHELGPRAQHAAERMQLANLQAERHTSMAGKAQLQTRNRKRLRALEERHLREKQLATYTAMVALAVADGRVSHQEREASPRLPRGACDRRGSAPRGAEGGRMGRQVLLMLSTCCLISRVNYP